MLEQNSFNFDDQPSSVPDSSVSQRVQRTSDTSAQPNVHTTVPNRYADVLFGSHDDSTCVTDFAAPEDLRRLPDLLL